MVVKRASGMRHLIDTYMEADEPRKNSPFDNLSLLELIVKTGIAEAINRMPQDLRASHDAIAETIENNVRSKIVKEQFNDPTYADAGHAERDSARVRAFQKQTSAREAAMEARIGAAEQCLAVVQDRLVEIEKKLLLNPPAA